MKGRQCDDTKFLSEHEYRCVHTHKGIPFNHPYLGIVEWNVCLRPRGPFYIYRVTESPTGGVPESHAGEVLVSHTGRGVPESHTGWVLVSYTRRGPLESHTEGVLVSSTGEGGLESHTGGGLESHTGEVLVSPTGEGGPESHTGGALVSPTEGFQSHPVRTGVIRGVGDR